ncbi:MAG: alpha/beta hydrolase-fold protein [Verrucomicrobiota bacterium]
MLRIAFVFLLVCSTTFAAEPPPYGPDSSPQPGVPEGKLIQYTNWQSKVFPNTVRDWWIYAPAQVTPGKPSCVMVFQDGHDYVNRKGAWRVPTVFDNLIHKKQMPVTIGIFINPGHDGKTKPQSPWRVTNRSFEYDTLSDQYARFLLEEIFPEVEKHYALTKDPEGRAICGASSGGICSFTVAWERPDEFRKVLSTIGSFTNIRGGNAYPYLIRKTDRKPIRVWLQDGKNDLDNPHGNWPLANQMMASSLKYMGYDHRFVFTDGEHNSKDAGPLLPEALKWLWRE